ncbi:hypothetical protein PC129_g13581 [Phytophthora cactorum]|uniref:Acyltransferase n=1 Tax=Phytophthora cactorum TaxID=29920 RepID=A0A8T1A2Y2_9STRA|nr:hypothetical protein PC111_g14214 [Phytophthora cactorum]KAG2846533.1 hypothetical protein PC112_g1399 [Phytophthora cactorum]KAG2868811.1 hypothetical protein PC113_g689 [Phytophthora cactorum]KAG2954376.1 hypothetical protein PC117_g1224 [Phytophthora cactorum]KAG2987075.1 hypothetical protein PC118_g7478 [Phytophthora cactorum]
MIPTSKSQDEPVQGVFVYESLGFFAEDSKVPQWMQNFLTDVFSFVTAHYFVWSFPFLALFYFLHQHELDYVSVAMIALYLPSFFSGAQKTGKGNEWEAVRMSNLWGLMSKFLRIKIIREQELDPKKKFIFGFHPHGILVLSRIAGFGRNFVDVFPGITTRFGNVLREKVLKEGNSIIVYPGGVPEIFPTDPNSKETQLVLKNRLGFIKLAMRQGADLVPTFVFGEKWLYNMWTPSKSVTDFFRKTFGIPVLIFWGKFWWMPKAPAKGTRYGLVYGKPITMKQTPNPTDEEVRAVHAEYVSEIERIFKQYKSDFGYEEDETLAII